MLKPWTVALTASVLAAGLYYVRFGYDFGFSDQDEFVPLVMKWLDPELFARDWFVTLQASEFGIRTLFAGLVALLSWLLPLEVAVFTLHVATWLVLTISLYQIAIYLYDNKLTSLIFVIAGTVLTARWNPGGNDVFHSMLVPSSLAWAFGMWSLERLLTRNYFFAGILGSLAILVHPLVGVQICAVLGVSQMLRGPRPFLRYILPIFIVAVPLVMIFADLGASSASISESKQILTHVRAPHHYLPASFSATSWAKFGFLVLTGGCLLWIDPARVSRGAVRNSIFVLFGTCLVVLGVSTVMIETFQFGLITRLQPYNLAVFTRILGLLGCISVTSTFLPTGTLQRVETVLSQPRSLLVAFLFLLMSVFVLRPWYIQSNADQETSFAISAHLDPITATWIKQNTVNNALFAVPPSLSGFQIQTSRAQFVNFKAFPFTTWGSVEWLHRLQLVAPISTTNPGGTELMSRMDAAYFATRPSYWISTPELESIDYILRPLLESKDWSSSPATWCSSDWCIFSAESLASQQNGTN